MNFLRKGVQAEENRGFHTYLNNNVSEAQVFSR